MKVVWVIAGVPDENENIAVNYAVHTTCKRSTFRNVEFNIKCNVKIFTLQWKPQERYISKLEQLTGKTFDLPLQCILSKREASGKYHFSCSEH